MSRVTAPASKLSRSIGSTTARPSVDVPGVSLLPKYAELLRNRKTPREYLDSHSHNRHLTTRRIPAEVHSNPVHIPTHAPVTSAVRRTPVPLLFNPRHHQVAEAAEPPHTPKVVFVSENQKNVNDYLDGIDKIDVDEAAMKAHRT
ncbi:uncharacterized protein DNG_01216 [Cephalotrichum gorgonifer]|uniref:Uncharacterized protein n=1 Tax=Cephalotrichum gorgonifer TaxID=2041049 RepID=A0AAE8MR41_9PEZI|nr:uncharacterized protein DNG_01216 [Cephalotrichum gorgonifer]